MTQASYWALSGLLVASSWAYGPLTALARDPEPRIERVEAGEPAPFTGILMREEVAAQWRTEIAVLDRRVEIEAEACSRRAAVAEELAEARVEAERARRALEVSLWTDRAAELEAALRDRGGLLAEPAFWLVVGAAAVGVVLIAADP